MTWEGNLVLHTYGRFPNLNGDRDQTIAHALSQHTARRRVLPKRQHRLKAGATIGFLLLSPTRFLPKLRERMTLMKKTELLMFLFTLASTPIMAFAQRDGDAAGAACGALTCGAFGVVYVLILAVSIAIPIVIIVVVVKFIGKDATARGMPNANSIKWLGLLGLLGLIIYLLQRPQGNVLPCPSCGQNRMQGLPQCPHCGNA